MNLIVWSKNKSSRTWDKYELRFVLENSTWCCGL